MGDAASEGSQELGADKMEEIKLADSEAPEQSRGTSSVEEGVGTDEHSNPRNSPKKSSKGPLKIKVTLLDGNHLDLEEGVSVCVCFVIFFCLFFLGESFYLYR